MNEERYRGINEYKVIVDSTADFELCNTDPNIVTVTTPLMIGDEDWSKRFPDSFYERQEQLCTNNWSPMEIKTSPPSPEQIREAYEKVLSSGHDAVYATMSSTLSDTFKIARDVCIDINRSGRFANRAVCIDTLCISAGIAFLVEHLIRNCKTTYEALVYILKRRHDIVYLFSVEDLSTLIESGRVNHLSHELASLKRAKPVFTYDFNPHGFREVMLLGKSYSVNGVCKKMMKIALSDIGPRKVYLVHANNPNAIGKLYNLAKNERLEIKGQTSFRKQFANCYRISPAMGAHLGYSAFGMVYMRNPDSHPGAKEHLLSQHQAPLEQSMAGQDPKWIF